MYESLDRRKQIKSGEDFYQSLRRKLKVWAGSQGRDHPWLEWILLAPDFAHLLTRLIGDDRVSAKEKAYFGLVLAYFISPIDLLPEAILGPVGLLDDVCLAAYALNRFVSLGGDEVLREHWSGEEEVLGVLRSVLKLADRMLGKGLWNRVKRVVR